MPDNKSISQLTTAEQIGASDLYELAIPNAMTETGYISRKVSASELANLIVSVLQYQGLNTNAKTIITAINEVLQSAGGGVELTDTLEAGETTLTFTNASITTNSTIDWYVDETFYGVAPTNITTISGQTTLTFEAQEDDMPVKVVIK